MTLSLPFRLPQIGLAPKLVALAVLVASLAGGGVALTVISSARAGLRDQIFHQHLIMADLAAEHIADYVSGVQSTELDLADRPELITAVDRDDYAALGPQLARWQTHHQPLLDGMNLYSVDGTMLATGRPDQSLVGTRTVSAALIAEIAASGKPGRGVALISKTSGHPVLPLYVPVHASNGEVRAVLSATLSLDHLRDMLVSLELSPHKRVSVTDSASGMQLVSEDRDRVLATVSTGRNAASQHARAGDRGAIENVRSNGEPTLAAFSPVPGLPWGVLLQEPTADAYAPIEDMTREASMWVAVAMLLAGLVASALAVSLVRPLRKLRVTAERMANGDLARRSGVRRGDEIGELGHAIDRMAAQLQESMVELTRQALSDNLTTLPNRVLLRQRLDQAISSGGPLALLVMDLDRFKEVNDTLGHSAGDALLKELSHRLAGALGHADTMARLGGDEFAIVLPGASSAHASEIAERLLQLVGEPFQLDGRIVSIGASIGIAALPEHGPDADTLFRCADVAMYVAKRGGQGVAVYCAEHDEHTPDRLALIGELRNALDRGELTLAFQPLFDCQRDQVAAVEALARWPHPQHGLVPPDVFIPLAEQTGLIGALSRWVLREALKQQRAWQRMGLDLPVSVNLSMRDLHDPSLPETVASLLEELGVSPRALRVEITESSLMSEPARALATLSQLRQMGVCVSIDDFGTGYSSLTYLKKLPVDELKIDRSFVSDLGIDGSNMAIVRSTIDLAHNLGLSVVAEGIEDERSLELLRAFGCDKGQGYFFSRPLGADELADWLLGGLDSARAA